MNKKECDKFFLLGKILGLHDGMIMLLDSDCPITADAKEKCLAGRESILELIKLMREEE